jgi:serine/threonine protein kinase
MVDENMNIKFIDFGFAARGNIHELKEMYGTKSYLAPEIRAGQVYDGTKSDIFSTGVVLYILVRGIFPFQKADKDDNHYSLMCNYPKAYWA